MELEQNIQRVQWTENEISVRVAELGAAITEDFKHLSTPLIVIGVATGAFMFLADVVRKMKLPMVVDFVKIKSYGSGTESNGDPQIVTDIKVDIKGKHTMVVEDIVDTGNTLFCLISHLKEKGASSISICTLLDKPARHQKTLELVGEGKFYCGFECPDYFVVGYGFDYAELYRNLPYIGILKPEVYK